MIRSRQAASSAQGGWQDHKPVHRHTLSTPMASHHPQYCCCAPASCRQARHTLSPHPCPTRLERSLQRSHGHNCHTILSTTFSRAASLLILPYSKSVTGSPSKGHGSTAGSFLLDGGVYRKGLRHCTSTIEASGAPFGVHRKVVRLPALPHARFHPPFTPPVTLYCSAGGGSVR